MTGCVTGLIKLKNKPVAGGIKDKVLILTDEQNIIIQPAQRK